MTIISPLLTIMNHYWVHIKPWISIRNPHIFRRPMWHLGAVLLPTRLPGLRPSGCFHPQSPGVSRNAGKIWMIYASIAGISMDLSLYIYMCVCVIEAAKHRDLDQIFSDPKYGEIILKQSKKGDLTWSNQAKWWSLNRISSPSLWLVTSLTLFDNVWWIPDRPVP